VEKGAESGFFYEQIQQVIIGLLAFFQAEL
jgi:hypothetical protein